MFFKEMTIPKPVPQEKTYTNKELKLMNWRVESFYGQWCSGPIPKLTTFNYNDRNWEVKVSKFSFMGWGLFTMDPAKAGDSLLPFVGPQYTASQYRKMNGLVPRFKSYVLKAEDNFYTDGRVELGNVASFINSSIGREGIDNCIWEYSLLPRPLNKNECGYVMTIFSRDIEVGEELYTHYPVN